MKKLLLGTIAIVVFVAAESAGAADLPAAPVYKAPILAPAVYNWTGFYVGGNVGYSWGRTSNDYVVNTFPLVNPALTLTSSDSLRMNGAIGGGQVGYNYQVNNSFLLGIETDIQFSDEKAGNSILTCNALNRIQNITCDGANLTKTYTEKLDWFGTARGRLGFLPADRWLVYVTGGLAYGELKIDGTTVANVPGNAPFATLNDSISKTKSGFVIGVGIEAALWNNWSTKLEYLHMDLGNLGTSFVSSGAAGLSQLTTTHNFTDDILRVGINYRFGEAPVVAKY